MKSRTSLSFAYFFFAFSGWDWNSPMAAMKRGLVSPRLSSGLDASFFMNSGVIHSAMPSSQAHGDQRTATRAVGQAPKHSTRTSALQCLFELRDAAFHSGLDLRQSETSLRILGVVWLCEIDFLFHVTCFIDFLSCSFLRDRNSHR